MYSIAEWVSQNIATIGVGLEHCHVHFDSSCNEALILTPYLQVPGTIAGDGHLSSSEIEIGMGIHNEAGVQRVSPTPPLNELIQTLLDLLLSQSDPERGFLRIRGSGKDNVVLLVNNLGGVSELELGGIVREAITALSARGVAVLRVVSGTFMVT